MKTLRANDRGVALVAVILILSFLMALAATMAVCVDMDTKLRGAFAKGVTGFYAAEAGLNKGMGDYKDLFLNFRVPTGSDFTQKTLTVGQRTVTYQLTNIPGNPQTVTIPSGQVFGGLNAIQYIYNASSQATKTSGDIEASVGSEFQVGYIPLFQFIAFFSNDLEIEPGADMHLHGRVHTNGNLYLNSDAHLWIEDNQPAISTVQVSARGDVYRGRKDTSVCGGTVTVDMLTDADHNGNLDPKDLTCTSGTTRKVPISELSGWNGSMVSKIESISVPQPDITTKGTGVFWTNADLRIVLKLFANAPPYTNANPPHTIVVEDGAGNVDAVKNPLLQAFMRDKTYNTNFSSAVDTWPIFYTDVPNAAGSTCSNAVTACNNGLTVAYDSFFSSNARVYGGNMVSTDCPGAACVAPAPYPWRGGFYQQREDKWMYLLNVNVHDLLDWNSRQAAGNQLFDPTDQTDGGLVLFLSVEGPSSAGLNNYGVRLFRSQNLPFPAVAAGGDPTGITVVSDQAMYVAGDYNSTGTKQPAAIIGDTLNVLSNNYFSTAAVTTQNDQQSVQALANAGRIGTSTTINSAFLAGTDISPPGAGNATYSGGFENFPRFHESWSGNTLTYAGSYVSLGIPFHANGLWCGTGNTCNIYNPPARNWDYEPAFNDVKNLPPLTPRFVYVQQVLFTEDFK